MSVCVCTQSKGNANATICLYLQISMNVPNPTQTSATPTLCVTTLKDPICAAVLTDTRAMVGTAQVNTFLGFTGVDKHFC